MFSNSVQLVIGDHMMAALTTGPPTLTRVIFEKSTKVQYRQVDDLAIVWCEYAEMELRHE